MASRPRRRILVVNPNSNEVVTKGLADALAPIAFADGPEIDCVTLKEGPYGIETQEHVESVALPLRRLVAGSNEVDAFVIACYSDPGPACRAGRPRRGRCSASTRRRADRAGARRALRRHRHRPALDPPARALHAPDGADGALPASARSNMSVAETASGEKTLDRMIEVGKELRDEDGADVIVMGCAGMARHRQPLEAALGIPVIDPTQAAVAMAIGAVQFAGG